MEGLLAHSFHLQVSNSLRSDSHVELEHGDSESSPAIEPTSEIDQALSSGKAFRRGNVRWRESFLRAERERPKNEARARRLCHEKHQLRRENHQLSSQNHRLCSENRQLKSEKDELEARLRELQQQHQIILVANRDKDKYILGSLQGIHTKLVSTAHALQSNESRGA